MNERIKQLAVEAGMIVGEPNGFDMTRLMPKEVKVAELIVAEAFRAGMLYSAKKYAAVCEDRFTGNDVAMFLEMEACELSDQDIKQHFGVEE